MPTINENLKLLRQATEFTQDDVAKKIGLTRQTISSYESNRTQPDIETLKRLAEIYNVGLNDILYGKNGMQIKRRNIKTIAIVALIDMFVCNLIQSILILMANKYFHVESGLVAEKAQTILNTRMSILHLHDNIEAFSMVTFTILCVLLLALLIMLEHPIALNEKLKFLISITLGSIITILPWSAFDNIYSIINVC